MLHSLNMIVFKPLIILQGISPHPQGDHQCQPQQNGQGSYQFIFHHTVFLCPGRQWLWT